MSKTQGKSKNQKKNKAITIVGALVLVLIIIFVLNQSSAPERSVAAYCEVYAQEKARLEPMSDKSNPYPSGVFDVTVSNASEIANSFSKLEPVAPEEIESQVTSLQKLYQDIHDNPSHLISNSINGGALDDSLKAWTGTKCR